MDGAVFRPPARCETGDCVQVAFVDGRVAVRDGKRPDGPVLLFTREEWDAFVAGAKDGEFDV
jgi:hypothetical protein